MKSKVESAGHSLVRACGVVVKQTRMCKRKRRECVEG